VIEAELKASVRDPGDLHQRLRQLAAGQSSTYRDVYYDRPGGDFTANGRELRLREISQGSQSRSLLTYKEPTVDEASGSKPEYETQVSNSEAVDVLLRALGFSQVISFEKHCVNYRFRAAGRDMKATVATVPELAGTFLELETMTEAEDTREALTDIRAVMSNLGVAASDLTTEQYTEAVMRARRD
jgi:adenylate cyclase, class 2